MIFPNRIESLDSSEAKIEPFFKELGLVMISTWVDLEDFGLF